ncbi:MAG TPA: hypothetical protein VMH86_11365 [Rhizomicrobium sp.]|nr:hypothetical protein [Rhizomicrobium sp.]
MGDVFRLVVADPEKPHLRAHQVCRGAHEARHAVAVGEEKRDLVAAGRPAGGIQDGLPGPAPAILHRPRQPDELHAHAAAYEARDRVVILAGLETRPGGVAFGHGGRIYYFRFNASICS